MIFKAFANVVTTNGSTVQNHGRRSGMISIKTITAVDIKKASHHFAVDSVADISCYLVGKFIIKVSILVMRS